jgi:hypothetical protein
MRVILVALLALLSSFASPAQASVVRRVPLATLVQRSDTVVRGRVLAQQSGWDSARRQIFTDVEIDVVERYKNGGAPARLRVRHLGGSVDGVTMHTLGEVAFVTGEEVVLFLARSSSGAYRSVALAQGKWRIVHGAAINDWNGALVVEPGADGKLRVRSGRRSLRSLAGLVAEIRACCD